MVEKVTVKQAAKELGTSEQFIRICMQRGLIDLGIATKLTGSKYTYLILRKKLDAYKAERGTSL